MCCSRTKASRPNGALTSLRSLGELVAEKLAELGPATTRYSQRSGRSLESDSCPDVFTTVTEIASRESAISVNKPFLRIGFCSIRPPAVQVSSALTIQRL